MNKTAKIWLILAASLVIIGSCLFVFALAKNHWHFANLGIVKYQTSTHTVNENFHSLSIEANTADIFFSPSHDGTCKVICYEAVNNKFSVSVINGTLTIYAVSEKEWYDYISIDSECPTITIYLPEDEYESIYIQESTGDILIENVNANTFDLNVSTGDIYLKNIACKNLFTTGNTGDIFLQDVIGDEKFSIKRSTGDVTFDSCDAKEIFIHTGTGDVEGILRSHKIFKTETSTGDIHIPDTTTGGTCEIITSTGDIHIEIQ